MADVTLAELKAKEAELIRKISSGELTVNYQGHSVTFRTMREMKEALAFTRTEIAKLSGASPRKQQIRFVTSDGYGNAAS